MCIPLEVTSTEISPIKMNNKYKKKSLIGLKVSEV